MALLRQLNCITQALRTEKEIICTYRLLGNSGRRSVCQRERLKIVVSQYATMQGGIPHRVTTLHWPLAIACEFVTWNNNKTIIDMCVIWYTICMYSNHLYKTQNQKMIIYILYCTCWTFKSHYIFFSSECNLYLL